MQLWEMLRKDKSLPPQWTTGGYSSLLDIHSNHKQTALVFRSGSRLDSQCNRIVKWEKFGWARRFWIPFSCFLLHARFRGPGTFMDKARLLLIGASGFLGAYAARKFAESFEVFTGSRVAVSDSQNIQIDITDASSVDATFQRAKPDAVLLLAALSDIDRCEAEPELAFATNVRGPENVANACARSNAKLLFTSSAAVFDGSKHGYTEEDAPAPLSVYGETKASAEAAI